MDLWEIGLEVLDLIYLVPNRNRRRVLVNTVITARFEVLTAVRMTMFFWVLTPCRLVGR
jgi:hypothetical protein